MREYVCEVIAIAFPPSDRQTEIPNIWGCPKVL